MRVLALPALLFVLSSAACKSPSEPSSSTTGLFGTVLRGPIQPVCAANQTCDAPFSSGFTILKLGTIVGTFQSDAQGHYAVGLPAGGYTIVPDADAPIMMPRSQSKDVTVSSTGMTMLDLHFDTGIR